MNDEVGRSNFCDSTDTLTDPSWKSNICRPHLALCCCEKWVLTLANDAQEKRSGESGIAARDSDQHHGTEREKAALARVYDYVLGGASNFAVDRELAERVLAIIPGYRDFARANRSFLRRSALQMVAAGIDQFLDLGSGMLTAGPVHEIVHAAKPACRVVYVDNDPVVTAHLRLGMADERVGVVEADICDVDEVLDNEVTRRVLDRDRPVGVFAVAVLHCLAERDQPAAVLRGYHDRLGVGSVLAASHASGDDLGAAVTQAGVAGFAAAGITVVSRTRGEFIDLLGPWRPQPDGVVPINWWRPDEDPASEASLGYAVLASSTRPPGDGASQ